MSSSSPDNTARLRDPSGRTWHWLQDQLPADGRFRSPDSPPSDVQEADAESDHLSSDSLPPPMVLKYAGGREVPIYHDGERSHHVDPWPSSRRSHHHPHHTMDHGQRRCQPISPADNDYFAAPEEIQILPSDPHVQPQRVAGSYSARPRRASAPPPPTGVGAGDHQPPAAPPYPVQTQTPAPTVYPYPQQQQQQHMPESFGHSHSGHGRRPPMSAGYAATPSHYSSYPYPPPHPHAPMHPADYPAMVYNHKQPYGHGRNYSVTATTGGSVAPYSTHHPAVHGHGQGHGHGYGHGNGYGHGHVPPHHGRNTTQPPPPHALHKPVGLVPEEPRWGPRGPRTKEDVRRPRTPSRKYSLSNGQPVVVEPSLYGGSSTTKSTSMPRTPDSVVGHGLKRSLIGRLISFATRPPIRRNSIGHLPKSR